MTNPSLDERIAAWLDRLHRAAGCDVLALYFLAEAGGQTLDLTPHVASRGEHPLFPSPLRAEHAPDANWNYQHELPIDALPFPPGFGTDCTLLPLGMAGLGFGLLVAVNPKKGSALTEAIAQGQIELFRLWVEYLVDLQERTLKGILKITTATASTLSLRQVLTRLVQEAAVLFSAKLCSLMLVDEERAELVLQAAYGCSLEYLDRPNLSIQDSLFGRVALDLEPRIVDDVRVEADYRDRELAKIEGLCSLVAMPVLFGEECLGVLGLYSATARGWTTREVALIESLASSAAVAIRNATLAEEMHVMETQMRNASRLATLGELSATFAHQLRNPLAVLNVLAHSWEQAPPTPEQTREDVQVIASKIRELNEIVESAVRLARQRPLKRRLVALEAVVEKVLAFLDFRIVEKSLRVEFEKPPRARKDSVDPDRLQHAFLNLLTNAMDALDEEGLIELTVFYDKKDVTLEIHDSGPGLDPKIADRLGEPFLTTKSEGLGLGVSIAKRIILDHGGQLTAENHPQGGAVMRVTLPVE